MSAETTEQLAREASPTLGSRGAVYGPYRKGVATRNAIIMCAQRAYKEQHGEDMPALYVEFFWDIANKLSRLAVSPTHMDSWHDIAGYATLIEATLKDEEDGI